MVDCVIYQKRLIDRQPVSLPLKTLGFPCFKTEGLPFEWHIRACGDNQVDPKTPDLPVKTNFWKTHFCILKRSGSVISHTHCIMQNKQSSRYKRRTAEASYHFLSSLRQHMTWSGCVDLSRAQKKPFKELFTAFTRCSCSIELSVTWRSIAWRSHYRQMRRSQINSSFEHG